jgi:uncharacterized protein (TIGR03067 family)
MVALGAVSLLAAADAPRNEATRDRKQLQGEWAATAVENNGQALAASEVAAWRLVVKDKSLTFRVGDQGGTHALVLDASKKPRAIDVGKFKGIYEVKGDTLKLCYALEPSRARPASFREKEGTTYQVYKRVRN